MQLKNILILLFLALLYFPSCKKNQLKKPTDVSFKADINRASNSSGSLIFTGGNINIAEFDIEGKRQQGDDISFSKEFENGLLINFDPNNSIPEIDFDIPQGIYESLEISFKTFENESDITITCLGEYTKNSGTIIPLQFEFMSSEYFSISAEDDNGSANVTLDKDTPAIGLIIFDPIYWFEIIPPSSLENASLTELNGIETLLINESANENLYELIVSRIEESTEIFFGH